MEDLPEGLRWDDQEGPRMGDDWEVRTVPPIPKDLDQMIAYQVHDLVSEFSGPGGLDRLISEVYSYAPYDFQRNYQAFRASINGRRKADPVLDGMGPAHLATVFNKAMESFPNSNFPGLVPLIPCYNDLMRALLIEDDIRTVHEVSEEFWFNFCYHLRLNDRGHENVRSETLLRWIERADWESKQYPRTLGDQILETEASGVELGPDALRMAGRRKMEKEEDIQFLNSFREVLDGFGEYLDAQKR